MVEPATTVVEEMMSDLAAEIARVQTPEPVVVEVLPAAEPVRVVAEPVAPTPVPEPPSVPTVPAIEEAVAPAVVDVKPEAPPLVLAPVIEPAPGQQPSDDLAAELMAYAREKVAHYMAPRSIDFIEEMPRLPTGKLYTRVLRDPYWQDRKI